MNKKNLIVVKRAGNLQVVAACKVNLQLPTVGSIQ